MIQVKVFKLELTGYQCANPGCKKLPEYHNHIIGNNYDLKPDTIVATISLLNASEIYCGGCIPEIYRMIKSKLDKNLWAFH